MIGISLVYNRFSLKLHKIAQASSGISRGIFILCNFVHSRRAFLGYFREWKFVGEEKTRMNISLDLFVFLSESCNFTAIQGVFAYGCSFFLCITFKMYRA